MASAISGFINSIRTAVYGEQVRSAIIGALEACYSDVESPSLNQAAFTAALNEAYAGGILDIQTVTNFNDMTNDKIIYRYNGTAAGKQKGLYYFSALSNSWVLIGSEIQKVSLLSQMTDTNDIYKYIGTETGMIQNSIYCHNGTTWTPIGSGILTASSAAQMTNTDAIYKYTGNQSGYKQNALYYYNGTAWIPVGTDEDVNFVNQIKSVSCDIDGYLSNSGVTQSQTSAAEKRSDYVAAEGTTFIHLKLKSETLLNYWYRICFYDGEKHFLNQKEATINNINFYENKIPVLQSAKYFRICFRTYNTIESEVTAYHAITYDEIVSDKQYDISKVFASDGEPVLMNGDFDNSNWVDGYINTDGATLIDGTNDEMTNIKFIPVVPGKRYVFSNSNAAWSSSWIAFAGYSGINLNIILRTTITSNTATAYFIPPEGVDHVIISSRNMKNYYQTATFTEAD